MNRNPFVPIAIPLPPEINMDEFERGKARAREAFEEVAARDHDAAVRFAEECLQREVWCGYNRGLHAGFRACIADGQRVLPL